MRSAHARLAGIVAMACGALTATDAVAMQDGSPAATGECAARAEGDAAVPVADGAQDERAWPAGGALALSDARLDAMRGGFDMPDGLKVSFGISRVAFVNGNLVASTSFNIPDVGQMTAQQAQALASANAGALLQVGNGNTVQAGTLPTLTGAVIQNTLNNQHLQTLTTINTTVNTLSLFKNLNIMSTINSALTGALPGR